MASKRDIDLYIPGDQTATLLFTKKGEIDPETGEAKEIVVMWMDVKADLTFKDRERLFWDDSEHNIVKDDDGNPVLDKNGKTIKEPLPDEFVWDRLAPFVLDWSVGERVNGKAVKIAPPAEAGGKQFELISPDYVRKLLADLRFRSTGKVDTDFLAR